MKSKLFNNIEKDILEYKYILRRVDIKKQEREMAKKMENCNREAIIGAHIELLKEEANICHSAICAKIKLLNKWYGTNYKFTDDNGLVDVLQEVQTKSIYGAILHRKLKETIWQ